MSLSLNALYVECVNPEEDDKKRESSTKQSGQKNWTLKKPQLTFPLFALINNLLADILCL